MDTLKFAWKLVCFYGLTPQTLARLTRLYGLREVGGLAEGGQTGKLSPTRRQQIVSGMKSESDPRVRYCLRHQFAVTRRARVLRARGHQAHVRGWLVVVRGGKPACTAGRPGRLYRRSKHFHFGQLE